MTQPEALRLADSLNAECHDDALNYDTALEAAAELRRLYEDCEVWQRDYDLLMDEYKHLHEVNQELLEVCVYLDSLIKDCGVIGVGLGQMRKTIAKAKGESK